MINKPNILTMQIIYGAIYTGAALFLLVIIKFSANSSELSEPIVTSLNESMMLIAYGLYLIAFVLNRFLLEKIVISKSEADINRKFNLFFSTAIVKIVIIDGGVLVTLVSLFQYTSAGGALTDYSVTLVHFVSLFVFSILWLIFLPSLEKVARIMGVRPEQLKTN